jgi:ATP-dependent RNA helicase RhlB
MKKFILSAGQKIRKIARAGKRSYGGFFAQKVGDIKKNEPLLENSVDVSLHGKLNKIEPLAKDGKEVEGKFRQPAKKKSHPSWNLDSFPVTPQEGKSRFHDYEIPLEVMRAIADQKFNYCTPIQEKSLADVLAGKDLVGQANTGTGKTAVFLVAILSHLLAARKTSGSKGDVKALVLAPTRELVVQIAKDGVGLAKYCGISVKPVYGGVDYQKQLNMLKYKKADVVIATPGRLIDFMNKGVIDLKKCSILVLDEADRMLDMGFIPDVRRIVGRLPRGKERQTMLFSATVPEDVRRLASQWCVHPKLVEAEPEQAAVDTVEQTVYLTTAEEKYTVLYNLLRNHPGERILVFANMKNETKRLANRLQRNDIDCVLLSGDVDQNKRSKRLERFREGKVKVLVATDVAGRGIHIEGITFVVNYTLPYEPEDYIHRIGRTGRAGASGKSVSFACEEGSFYLPAIEELIDRKLDCVVPEESLLIVPPKRAEKENRQGFNRSQGEKKAKRRYKPNGQRHSRPVKKEKS